MKKISMHNIFKSLKNLHISKNAKNSTIMLALISVVVCIAVLINLLVGFIDLKLDLTSGKLYTIGDTTQDILNGLEKDVSIYGTFDNGEAGVSEGYGDAVYLLEQYEKYSHINVEYIDLDRTPGFIGDIDPDNILDIKKSEFIIKCGDKSKKLDAEDLFTTEIDYASYSVYATGSNAEQAFTGAIMYVTAEMTPTLYFASNHGEADLEAYYSTLKNYLERNNYDIKTLDLLVEEIPEDALAVLIFSPQSDISAAEAKSLEDYLINRGGNAFFIIDPLTAEVKFNELNKVLENYNVALNNDVLVENASGMYYPMSQYYLIPKLQQNEITSDFYAKNYQMLVPGSRSIETLLNEKEEVKVFSLLSTSDTAESLNMESEDNNEIGLFDIAAVSRYEKSNIDSKIMVMGNSTFLADEVVGTYGQTGIDFFVKMVFWMNDASENAIIEAKPYDTGSITVTAQMQKVTSLLLAVALPLLVFGAGVFVYLRRRHL